MDYCAEELIDGMASMLKTRSRIESITPALELEWSLTKWNLH